MTDNPEALQLGLLSGDQLVTVEVSVDG